MKKARKDFRRVSSFTLKFSENTGALSPEMSNHLHTCIWQFFLLHILYIQMYICSGLYVFIFTYSYINKFSCNDENNTPFWFITFQIGDIQLYWKRKQPDGDYIFTEIISEPNWWKKFWQAFSEQISALASFRKSCGSCTNRLPLQEPDTRWDPQAFSELSFTPDCAPAPDITNRQKAQPRYRSMQKVYLASLFFFFSPTG